MVSRVKHIGTVKLGAESYLLAETEGKQAWQKQFLHEPPWSEGLPSMLSEPSDTWHLGGLKSKQGVPGTSEYGQNTDARFPFRLLPGPEIVALGVAEADTSPVTSIFEALGYIWFTSGRFVYRVNPATDAITTSKDFGASVNSITGIRSENNTGLVTTDAADQSLWEVSAIGTPDTWTQAAVGVKPYRLAKGIDRLFGVQANGLLRNVVSGLSPLTAINWADRIQCGETTTKPTGLLAFEKTVLVGKPEGLFGVSPEGKGVSLISRIARDDNNFSGMILMEPYAILPHSRGAYRFLPGLVESIGLERETMNEGPVRGRFRAYAVDGPWLLGFLDVGNSSYLMVARERRSGEPGFGPLVWDTWAYSPVYQEHAVLISFATSPPRIWFGQRNPLLGTTNKLSYIKLSDSAGAPDVDDSAYRFALSGVRYSNKYRFGDWGSKDYPKVDLVGKNLTSVRYWELYFSVDGGAFSNLDVNGVAMRINSNGRKTFFLPLTAVGREIQYRFNYTGDVNTTAGELNYFEPFAVPQSRKLPVHVIQLHLARDSSLDIGIEHRAASEQLSDLATLNESAAPIKASGPWGEDKDMVVRSLQLVQVMQEPDVEAEYLVEVGLQEREVA